VTPATAPTLSVRTGNGAPTELERAQLAQEGHVTLRWGPLLTKADAADEAAPESDAVLSQPLPLETLLAGWRPGQGINLRQGSLQMARQGNSPWLRWRAVAALAGIWFLVALAGQAGQAVWAGQQADRVEREVRERFANYFPDEQRTAQTAGRGAPADHDV
jgi:type II secretory pathway component PulL